MKKAINIIIMYFIFLLAGTLFSTIFYSFYLYVTNFIAGSKITPYSTTLFLQAFFYVFPCVFILICPILCYYRLRHIGNFWQTGAFFIISAISWLIFYPLTVKASDYYFSKNPIQKQENPLTGKYFRKTGNTVYYFVNDFNPNDFYNEDSTILTIDTSEEGKVNISKIPQTRDFSLYRDSAPYNDLLIKNTFTSGKNLFTVNFSLFHQNLVHARQKGLTFILGYFTFAFLICSLYCCTNIFNWKLINASILVFSTAFSLILNTVYFNPMFDSFKNRFIKSNSFFNFLGNYIDEPLLCLINLVIGLFWIIIGIIMLIVRKHEMER